MRTGQPPPHDDFTQTVRIHLFRHAAETGQVPQVAAIAAALAAEPVEVRAAVQKLAADKVVMLAPHDGDIWAANPFCAVPSGFRVETNDRVYWGICIWDAMGVVAALHADQATITAPCGDCGALLRLEFNQGELLRTDLRVHFAVPARDWWKNVGYA